MAVTVIFLSAMSTSCGVSDGPSINSEKKVSTDSSLTNLNLGIGTLVPAFSKDIQSYTVSVAYSSANFQLLPTASDPSVTITVGSTTAPSGGSTQTALAVGPNVIPVVVTAGNGSTTTYTLTVVRAAPSMDATLSQLLASAGTITPAFSPTTLAYQLSVSDLANAFNLTPTSTNANALIKVQLNTAASQTAVSGSTFGPMSLLTGANTITVTVTAEDGVTTQAYAISLTYGICAAGSYSDGVNGCSLVGRGYYSTGNDVTHACANLPANAYYTSTQATSANCPWSCNDGFLTTDGVSCASYPNALNLTCDNDEVAVGLYGRSGSILDRLGVRCAIFNPDSSLGAIRSGPTYGGNGGGAFNYDGLYDCPAGTVLNNVRGNLATYLGVNRSGEIQWTCINPITHVVTPSIPMASPFFFGTFNDRGPFNFSCGTSPNNYGNYINGLIIDNSSGAGYTGDTLGINCR